MKKQTNIGDSMVEGAARFVGALERMLMVSELVKTENRQRDYAWSERDYDAQRAYHNSVESRRYTVNKFEQVFDKVVGGIQFADIDAVMGIYALARAGITAGVVGAVRHTASGIQKMRGKSIAGPVLGYKPATRQEMLKMNEAEIKEAVEAARSEVRGAFKRKEQPVVS